jgi:hypothetical protein
VAETVNVSAASERTPAVESQPSLLYNPHTYDPVHLDPESRRMVLAMVEWFESRGGPTAASTTSATAT